MLQEPHGLKTDGRGGTAGVVHPWGLKQLVLPVLLPTPGLFEGNQRLRLKKKCRMPVGVQVLRL